MLSCPRHFVRGGAFALHRARAKPPGLRTPFEIKSIAIQRKSMPKGGKRAGAGRPRGRKSETTRVLEAAMTKAAADLPSDATALQLQQHVYRSDKFTSREAAHGMDQGENNHRTHLLRARFGGDDALHRANAKVELRGDLAHTKPLLPRPSHAIRDHRRNRWPAKSLALCSRSRQPRVDPLADDRSLELSEDAKHL